MTDFRGLVFLRLTLDVTPRSLAEYLSLSLSATTALVDRLVATGYAVRSPNPEDGRSVRLATTQEGTDAVDLARDLYTTALEASIPVEDRDEVAMTFMRVADALAEVPVERHPLLSH